MKMITGIRHWLQASRLPSQLYIFMPIVLGQSIAYRSWNWDLDLFILLTLYGIFIQLFIIYANDYADQETDSLNTNYTLFSGGSRVLVDNKIQPYQLLIAAWGMAGLSLGISLYLLSLGFVYAPLFWLASTGLLWMYSYPPIKLSYRGGGELLQAMGIGIVLPLFGFYISGGEWVNFPWWIIPAMFPTQVACAITTSLPDQISDSLSKKNTFTVLFGDVYAKFTILGLQCLAVYSMFFLGYGIFYLSWFSISFSILWLDGKPGNPRLNWFIFFNLLATLSFELHLIISYLIE